MHAVCYVSIKPWKKGSHGAFFVEKLSNLPAGEWRRVQKAEGYRWIMVNGNVTFEDGKCTGATPGKLLRSGRAV
jgi:N-acyl-D-aspartate/D-glutamate deacylase